MPDAMPIMGTDRPRYLEDLLENGFPFIVSQIPWKLIAPHEKQAQINHGLSLEALAARGGLEAVEALAIMENRPWKSMRRAEANKQLAQLLRHTLAPTYDEPVRRHSVTHRSAGMAISSALDLLTIDQIRDLRAAGFVVIHREPTDAMLKAFSAGKWPEQVDFREGFHRLVAESIRSQNRR